MALCRTCARDFVNSNALEQHLRDSKAHARRTRRAGEDLPKASQIQSRRKGGGTSPASDNELVPGVKMLQISSPPEGSQYIGVAHSLVKPVFRVACSLRRDNPSVQLVRDKSKSLLDDVVIAALIHAAERLNSLDENVEQAQERAEKQRQRSQLAQIAEDSFVKCVASKGYSFEREADQRTLMISTTRRMMATPDLRFRSPTVICGFWLARI